MQIHKSQSTKEATRNCADALLSAIGDGKVPTFLLLSGGSAFGVIDCIWERKKEFKDLTIGFVDERLHPDQSNFVLLSKNHGGFLSALSSQGNMIIDTSPRFKSVEETADWYNGEIERTFLETESKNGKIIALLGIGADGHTAGILPYPSREEKDFYELFLDTDRLVVGYDATGKSEQTKRFTLTYPALMRINELFVYAVGDQKQKAIETMQDPSIALHQCPASFYTLTSQPVTIFTTLVIPAYDGIHG